MRNLKDMIQESILDDVDITLTSMDKYVDRYRCIEKDWRKLCNTKKYYPYFSTKYIIKIKSPVLAEFLLENIPVSNLNVERVCIAFDIADACNEPNYKSYYNDQKGNIMILIYDNWHNLIAGGPITYCDDRDLKKLNSNDKSIDQSSKNEVTKTILDIISDSKLLKDLNYVKREFTKNCNVINNKYRVKA